MIIPWTYNGEPVVSVPEGMKAFVYLLELSDGSLYVGKKNFYSTTRRKVKGKTRRQVVVKESNWRQYLSSSEHVKRRLKEGQKLVRREILHLCKTIGESTYLELKEQIDRRVLCDPRYVNGWIYAKIMRCHGEDEDHN